MVTQRLPLVIAALALVGLAFGVGYVTYPLQSHGFEIYMWSDASNDAFEKMMGFFDKNL